jgi:hypothetical protein
VRIGVKSRYISNSWSNTKRYWAVRGRVRFRVSEHQSKFMNQTLPLMLTHLYHPKLLQKFPLICHITLEASGYGVFDCQRARTSHSFAGTVSPPFHKRSVADDPSTTCCFRIFQFFPATHRDSNIEDHNQPPSSSLATRNLNSEAVKIVWNDTNDRQLLLCLFDPAVQPTWTFLA